MAAWYFQMEHVARAEDLRRADGPHDVVVRTRLDLHLHAPLALPNLFELTLEARSRSVFAIAFRAVNTDGLVLRDCAPSDPQAAPTGATPQESRSGSSGGDSMGDSRHSLGACDTYFHDWLLVAHPTAFAAVAALSTKMLLHHPTIRCKGWCQEEQTLLQCVTHAPPPSVPSPMAHACCALMYHVLAPCEGGDVGPARTVLGSYTRRVAHATRACCALHRLERENATLVPLDGDVSKMRIDRVPADPSRLKLASGRSNVVDVCRPTRPPARKAGR